MFYQIFYKFIFYRCLMEEELYWPEPLPNAVSVIDSAVTVYGRTYPLVPPRHKLQMADHFAECIKSTKNTQRRQAVVFL